MQQLPKLKYAILPGIIYVYLTEDEKYLSLIVVLQAVLAVFANVLVLTAIKNMKEQKNRFLKITKLLSIGNIIDPLFGQSVLLIFLNYFHFFNCSLMISPHRMPPVVFSVKSRIFIVQKSSRLPIN